MSSNVFIIGVNKKIVEILRFKKHTPIHKIYKHKKVGIAIDTINFSGQCSGVFIFWTKKKIRAKIEINQNFFWLLGTYDSFLVTRGA